ncbi:MAG: methylcrotonoyl-CoA carboxylase, partial [Caulobacteraceae bacterium]
WQFRVAAGEPIPLKQADISMNGWAMEARLYAEDPANGFLPSIGRLEHFRLPPKVRADTGVREGGEVSQFYDPMIAKVIVHTGTRKDTAAKLARKCRQIEVWPVRTNAEFLARCLEEPDFIKGDVDTGFIGGRQDALTGPSCPSPQLVAAAFAALGGDGELNGWDGPSDDRRSPWIEGAFGFRLNAAPGIRGALYLNGEAFSASLSAPQGYEDHGRHFGFQIETSDGRFYGYGSPDFIGVDDRNYAVHRTNDGFVLFEDGAAFEFKRRRVAGPNAGPASDGSLRAPMPGKIVAAPAAAGDTVTKGQPIVVLEAMKMEHALIAPFNGVVESVSVSVGDQVGDGVVLAVVKAAESRAE